MPPSPSGTARRVRLAATAVAAVVAAVSIAATNPAHAVNSTQSTVVTSNPANWTPNFTDGTVAKIAAAGNRIYAGGTYTNVRNSGSTTNLNRKYLVALNRATGAIDTGFNAVLDGPVEAIASAADGLSVYVGGQFKKVNGVSSPRIVRLNAATGAIWPGWKPANLSAKVQDIKVLGSRLIVGGAFQSVNGASRPGLVALTAETGALDPYLNGITLSDVRKTTSGATSPLQVVELDITPNGSKMVMIGNFNKVNGQARGQVAIVDLGTTATLSSWATERFTPQCSTSTPTYMRGVSISPDGSYFAMVTTGSAVSSTSTCDSVTRWEMGRTGSGQRETWMNKTGGDTLLSVAVTGAAIYVGGHQRWLNNPQGRDSAGPGAVSREGIGAVDPTSGLALSWNPGKERGVGTEDILATPYGLWIGSDTNRVAGELRQRLAFFPL